MAVTVTDTFTDADDTLLADHTPDVGDVASWEAMGFGTGGGDSVSDDLIIRSNTLTTASATATASAPTHRNNTDPGSDEYDVAATFAFDAASTNRFLWLTLRMTPTGTADASVDRYLMLGNNDVGEWQLYKIVGGTLTTLDTQAASLASATFAVRTEVRAGGVAVFADDGGGEVQVLSSLDTEITQRGRVGVGGRNSGMLAVTQFLDDLSVDSVAGGGVVRSMAASMDAAGDADAAMAVTRPLAAAAPNVSDATAAMSVRRPLTASAAAVSDMTAAVTVRRPMTVAATLTADTTATLAVTRPLSASASTVSTMTAALSTDLITTIDVIELVANRQLAADARAGRQLTSDLDAERQLTADLAASV